VCPTLWISTSEAKIPSAEKEADEQVGFEPMAYFRFIFNLINKRTIATLIHKASLSRYPFFILSPARGSGLNIIIERFDKK